MFTLCDSLGLVKFCSLSWRQQASYHRANFDCAQESVDPRVGDRIASVVMLRIFLSKTFSNLKRMCSLHEIIIDKDDHLDRWT